MTNLIQGAIKLHGNYQALQAKTAAQNAKFATQAAVAQAQTQAEQINRAVILGNMSQPAPQPVKSAYLPLPIEPVKSRRAKRATIAGIITLVSSVLLIQARTVADNIIIQLLLTTLPLNLTLFAGFVMSLGFGIAWLTQRTRYRRNHSVWEKETQRIKAQNEQILQSNVDVMVAWEQKEKRRAESQEKDDKAIRDAYPYLEVLLTFRNNGAPFRSLILNELEKSDVKTQNAIAETAKSIRKLSTEEFINARSEAQGSEYWLYKYAYEILKPYFYTSPIEGEEDAITLHLKTPKGFTDESYTGLAEFFGAHQNLAEATPVTPEHGLGGHMDIELRKRARPKEALPRLVTLPEIAPSAIEPDMWARLPLGKDAKKELVELNLKTGPHVGIYGSSGSGKSVLYRSLIFSALTRDYEIIIIDPEKSGLDFLAFKPYALGWSDDNYPLSANLMRWIKVEGKRRSGILKSLGLPSITDMTPEQREQHKIKRILVVVDEGVGLLTPITILKNAPKDEDYEEDVAANEAKAVIASTLGYIARKLRSVGIHLAFATQRPDINKEIGLTGELRNNIKSVIQLSAPNVPLDPSSVTMAFGPSARVALDEFAKFDDGNHGLGVIASEGGTAKAFRVAYSDTAANPYEYAQYLDALGVPRVTHHLFEDGYEADFDTDDLQDDDDDDQPQVPRPVTAEEPVGFIGAVPPMVLPNRPTFNLPPSDDEDPFI